MLSKTIDDNNQVKRIKFDHPPDLEALDKFLCAANTLFPIKLKYVKGD